MSKRNQSQNGKSTGGRSPKGRQIEVVFALERTEANEVYLCGDFNQWSATNLPMTRRDDFLWEMTVSLPPGRYEVQVPRGRKVDSRSPQPGRGGQCLRVDEFGGGGSLKGGRPCKEPLELLNPSDLMNTLFEAKGRRAAPMSSPYPGRDRGLRDRRGKDCQTRCGRSEGGAPRDSFTIEEPLAGAGAN